ncbi:MAG: hypothetical protein LBB58_02930, partial [Cellulomonadaceae bacterium]|nr:hypothetical protein [Cellulomonadaceae bacterium]
MRNRHASTRFWPGYAGLAVGFALAYCGAPTAALAVGTAGGSALSGLPTVTAESFQVPVVPVVPIVPEKILPEAVTEA